MNKTLVLFLAVIALLLGCESTPHYNRTKVVMLGAPLPKRPYGTVKLFEGKEAIAPTEHYDVIAMMSVEGNAGDEAQFIKAFLYHAADVGADGLILYRVSQANNNAVFRGEAIHFK